MKIFFSFILFILLIGELSAQSCDVGGVLHYNFNDISNILVANNCQSCHNSTDKVVGWSFESYNSLRSPGDCGQKIVSHGNAAGSYLYNRLSGNDDICGITGDGIHVVSDSDLKSIESWINFGAPEFCIPFHEEIRSILNDNGCNSCHNATNSWQYENYNDLFLHADNSVCNSQEIIVKGDADNSLLYKKLIPALNDCGDLMIDNNSPISNSDKAMIRDWINGGTPQNAAALPVEISSFTIAYNDDRVLLEWVTEVEIATDRFVIQRSNSGKNFLDIGEVQAFGVSTNSQSYSFIDDDLGFGKHYYRLKVIDLDGTYDYSPINVITVTPTKSILRVYPNPAIMKDRIKVDWFNGNGQETTYLEIVDVNGESVHRRIIYEGTNYIRLPVLLDGIYYVMIEDYFGELLIDRVIIAN